MVKKKQRHVNISLLNLHALKARLLKTESPLHLHILKCLFCSSLAKQDKHIIHNSSVQYINPIANSSLSVVVFWAMLYIPLCNH